MAAQTGRTANRYVDVYIDDSGGTLRQIAVDTINNLGLVYDEQDLTAFIDAIHGVLLGHPNFSCSISGPLENTASTGTLTVLDSVNGENTPLSFDVKVGIRHAWEFGEPQFGISSSSTDGVVVSSFVVDPSTMRYTATIRMASGSAAPAWGTTAET